MSRPAVGGARRVVVKVGSASLTAPGGGLDPAVLDALVAPVATATAAGRQVVLVSSGAIAAGLHPLGLARRPRDLATLQAAASVGQGLLMAGYTEAFRRHGRTVGQVLLSADDVVRRGQHRNAQRTLERLLGLGVVPVVNENDTVATEEIRFGDNDRLAALVAHLCRADALVLLSDVAGLHDADPRRPGARLVPEVRSPADLAGVSADRPGGALGSGGMRAKVAAALLAAGAGIPVVVTAAGALTEALAGGPTGTYFRPAAGRASTRTLWLAHAADPRGRLRLDRGAVAAVVHRRMSLLPAGVVAVEGSFAAGDPVDLVDPDGTVVARGLVGYDAAELPGLLGRSTRDLAGELGPGYGREVVHRDDLVLLPAAGATRFPAGRPGARLGP